MKVALVAGEASGDLLGAGLIDALKVLRPNLQFEGVAGPAMEAAGCHVLEPAESLAVFGLIEPLKEIPRLLKLRGSLIKHWRNHPPDVFVGIDAPDFNLGLELRLRSVGIKTVHYVSPSVWAWRKGRVKKVEKAVDKVLCLLPFEKAFYDEHNVLAEFVGHPMADKTPTDLDTESVRNRLHIDSPKLIAVLPGSRMSEVSRLGPLFAQSCAALAADNDNLRFVAPMVNERLSRVFRNEIEIAGVANRFHILEGNAELAIAASDVVLLASGTATLQASLLGKPMVVAYRVAPLTYAMIKVFRLIDLPYFSLPNLLTDRPLVPEFLQDAATVPALTSALSALLDDPRRRAEISEEFRKLRDKLARGADQRAAQAVLDLAVGKTGEGDLFPQRGPSA